MIKVVFIFARGGSKGLPKKNTKLFCGKPLINWSINQAKNIFPDHQVIVSTDCEDIANISKECGASVPFMRPRSLALDDSSELDAWKHAIAETESFYGSTIETFISLPCTSPLRNNEDILGCFSKFITSDANLAICVTKSSHNPYFNMITKDSQNFCKKVINSENFTRRQDAPQIFDITTLCYIAKPAYILNISNILDSKILAYEVPKERSVDIDDLYDFEFAEYLFKKTNNEKFN